MLFFFLKKKGLILYEFSLSQKMTALILVQIWTKLLIFFFCFDEKKKSIFCFLHMKALKLFQKECEINPDVEIKVKEYVIMAKSKYILFSWMKMHHITFTAPPSKMKTSLKQIF